MHAPERVHQPGVEDGFEARALVVGHVRVADERRRLVNVEIRAADVEVAGNESGPVVGDELGHPLRYRLEEAQLVGERGGADGLAVRDVHAHDAYAVDIGLDPARFVTRGLTLEPGADVRDLRALGHGNGYTGPAPRTVMDRLVAHAGQLEL